MNIIIVLMTGLALLIILKVAKIFLKKITHRYPLWKNTQKVFPLIEIGFWVAFVFWAVGILFKDENIYPYLIVGLVLIVAGLFAWFFIRDVFVGAIFRAQNDLNNGDFIKIGTVSGQVKSVQLTHLEITSDNGQTIKIPNTRLNQELISSMTTPEGIEEFTICLKVDNRFEKDKIEEKIKFELANSPWCTIKNPPVIKLREESADSFTYDVLVYTLNHQHLQIAEKMLNEKFGIKP